MNNELHKYECSIHLVEYSKNDYEYEGHVNLLPNIVGSGKTYNEALNEIYANLEVYLNYCKENSISYPSPKDITPMNNLSGRVTVRLPKSLHYALNEYAKNDGMSLNSIIIDATREYISKKQIEKNIQEVINPILMNLKKEKNISLCSKSKIIKSVKR